MSDDGLGVGETIEHDPETGAYHARFDSSPATAVVEAIAAISDADPSELDPLYATVDGDALDQLLSFPAPPGRSGDLSVTFRYQGYAVTVHSYGVIRVERPSDDETEPA